MKKTLKLMAGFISALFIFSLSGCGWNVVDKGKNSLNRPDVEPTMNGINVTGKNINSKVEYINIYRQSKTDSGTTTPTCLGIVLPSGFDKLNETFSFLDNSINKDEGIEYQYCAKFYQNDGETFITDWSDFCKPTNTTIILDRTLSLAGLSFTYGNSEVDTDQILRVTGGALPAIKTGFSNLCLLVDLMEEYIDETAINLTPEYRVVNTQAIVIDESQTSFILSETLPAELLNKPICVRGIVAQYEEKTDPSSVENIDDVKVRRVYFSDIARFELDVKNPKLKLAKTQDNKIVTTVVAKTGKTGYEITLP